MAHVNRPAAAKAAKKRLKDPGALVPADRLRALREALGLTVREVSHEVGLTDPAICARETGKGCPDGATQHRIEAWTRRAAQRLGLSSAAAVLAIEWLPPDELAAVRAIAKGEAPLPRKKAL